MSSTPSSASPIRVRDIMSRYVVSVTEETPAIEVARILAERRFSGLPVLNHAGEEARFSGAFPTREAKPGHVSARGSTRASTGH